MIDLAKLEAQAAFDYAALDVETRGVVQQRTSEIRVLVKRAAQDIIDIGQKLIEVKDRLGHGNFGAWLEAEFDWTPQLARQFMRVSEEFGGFEKETMFRFAPSALRVLSSPSTPEPARLEAIERAETGESITYTVAQGIVAMHKDVSTLCPYCGCVYASGDDVKTCPNCSNLHIYSGPRDTEKYGAYALQVVPEKPHVAHNSGNNEWYTPPAHILAARRVMGAIDLDPASSAIANSTVGASHYHTVDDDGLIQEWRGRVWMNPPYAGELIGQFCGKLVCHVSAGDVSEAIVLVNNATETRWFQQMLTACQAVCFPKSRVRYLTDAGNPGAPLQGQALIYFGPNAHKFVSEFRQFGEVCEWHSHEAKSIIQAEQAS